MSAALALPVAVALVFLILSFVWAAYYRNEVNAFLLAVWAIACLLILSAIPGVLK